MIRNATLQEVPRICQMAEAFWAHTAFDDAFEIETTTNLIVKCIEDGIMLVAEQDDELVGFCCAIFGTLLVNSSVKIATEIAWWLEPTCRSGKLGIKLMLALEEQAKQAGAKYLAMCAMESSMPEQIKDIYVKLGYSLSESLYLRTL